MRGINTSNFIFFTDPPWGDEVVYRTLIPSSIKSTHVFFKYAASLLQIGGYFGFNWHALDEILRDFEWIKEYDIDIIHDGLPTLDDEGDLQLYLGMLSDAVDFWKGQGIDGELAQTRKYQHKLNIYFPEECKNIIESISLK